MLIVGLTGSIGMGKSTAGARFRQLGVPVFDADAAVHELYQGPLASAVESAFPGTTAGGRVDRAKLSSVLVHAPHRFRELETIVHPAVRAAERTFLHAEHARDAKVVVLEIPLLYETRAEHLVDAVVVVSSEPAVQRLRVLERPGMTGDKFDSLLKRQTPDSEKRHRADFVVDTSGSVATCHAQVDAILSSLANHTERAFAAHWQ